MPFHIEKSHPVGKIYYVGNLQWHRNKDNRMIFESEDQARLENNKIHGTITEET
tara:strand:+ start:623 stop:784 length:162 start_codon:yes stop_codon:yes gene_type:complete